MKPFSHPLCECSSYYVSATRTWMLGLYNTYIQNALQLNHLCALYLNFPEHFPYKRIPFFPPSHIKIYDTDSLLRLAVRTHQICHLWIFTNLFHSNKISLILDLMWYTILSISIKNINLYQYYENSETSKSSPHFGPSTDIIVWLENVGLCATLRYLWNMGNCCR